MSSVRSGVSMEERTSAIVVANLSLFLLSGIASLGSIEFFFLMLESVCNKTGVIDEFRTFGMDTIRDVSLL